MTNGIWGDLNFEDYKTPKVACPACGHVADYGTCFSGTGEVRPVKVGDLSMCVGCTVFLVYTAGFQLRLLTDGEWLAMPPRQRKYLTFVRSQMLKVKARSVPCTRCRTTMVQPEDPPLCEKCMAVVRASGGSELDEKWRRQ